MIFVPLLFAVISVAMAQSEQQDPDILNVITVPPNCPPGQQWINGMCRDIWSWLNNPNAANLGVVGPSSSIRNVVTVPTNCPPGQELINGICRDVWRYFAQTTPLPNKAVNSNLVLRDRRQSEDEVYVVDAEVSDEKNRNIINIPNQCPRGYKPDALGICRPILE